MNLVAEIINLICSLLTFTYGAHVSFRKRGVLFLQIITCAFGCFALGNIYNLCYFLCLENSPRCNFNIGSLGYIGGMFFLFSSYYGAMDRIGDNKNKNFRKYKIRALILSSLHALVCIVLILNVNLNIFLLSYTFLSSAVLYFALKHFFLPDIENGIIKVMRSYNLLIVAFCVIKSWYDISQLYETEISPYLKFLLCIITALSLPTASKGVKKWST